MKDLKQLHHEFTIASAAFRSAAIAEGWIRTDIGSDLTKYFWLPRDEHFKVVEMLKANEDPEEYCLDLAFENMAFFEY